MEQQVHGKMTSDLICVTLDINRIILIDKGKIILI